MANTLWIGNIAPGTTDEQIIELVKKYAPDLECKGVERVEGDGSRPATVLQFPDAEIGAVERAQMRDLVDITYSEAVAVAVRPVGKK